MNTGQLVLLIGAIMLAMGFILPYLLPVGQLPPTVYTVLQVGGIVLLIVGAPEPPLQVAGGR